MSSSLALTAALFALAYRGADAKSSVARPDSPTLPASAAPAPAPAPASMPAITPVTGADAQFEGEVRELLAAGSYTYFRVVDADQRERWVVAMDEAPTVGSRVRVTAVGERRQFHSRRLDRDFTQLLFATFTPISEPAS